MSYKLNAITGQLDLVDDPAGSTGQVQFNDSGDFGADTNFSWDNTSKSLSLGTAFSVERLTVHTSYPNDFAFFESSGDASLTLGIDASSNHSKIQSKLDGVYDILLLNPSGGNVGIGNTSPTELLSLGTNGINGGSISFAGNTSGKVIIQPATAAGSWTLTLPDSGGTSGYVLTTNGFGVSTWTVASGLGLVNSVSNGDGTLTISPTTGDVIASLNLGSYNTWTGEQTFSLDTFFPGNNVLKSTGVLGLGTLTPSTSYKLDMVGSLRIRSPFSTLTFSDNTPTNKWDIFYTSSGTTGLVFSQNGVGTKMFIQAGGNIGVSNSAPGELLTLGTTGTTKGVLSFAGNTSGKVIIQPAATAGSWSLTLPTSAGTNGYLLQTDGSGISTWVSPTASTAGFITTGSVVFAGSTGALTQDNANFFWDDANNRLGVGTNSPSVKIHALGTTEQLRLGYDASNFSSVTTTSTGLTNFGNNGTNLYSIQADPSYVGSSYFGEGRFQIDTADTTAGGNLLGSLKIRNLARNTFSVIPRANFGRLEVTLGNLTDQGYVVIESDQQNLIPRLDILYTNAYFGDPSQPSGSTTNFRGTFEMVRQGDATGVNNQQSSGAIAYQPSIWTGTAADAPVFITGAIPNQGQNNKYYFKMSTQSLNYLGSSFAIQSNNWRTQTFSDNIGINNIDPSAHLDIVEDSASRNIVQITGASSQSGDYLNIKNNSSTNIFKISSAGTTTINGDLQLAVAGNGLYIKEGTNATMGSATLVAGTVTISTTKVTANSRIFLTVDGGTLTNVGSPYVSARTAGTSFTISSTNILDASNVAWVIIEPS